MKSKIWIWQIPIIAIFTSLYGIQEAGLKGELRSPWLREQVYPWIHRLSGLHTNIKFHLRGPRPPKNPIVIVEIDNDSIEKFGRWPWHRDVTAELIQRIFDAGAKHVGLDMTFSERDERVSPALRGFLQENRLDSRIADFETDRHLANIIEFQSSQLTLGWMASHCQPLYLNAQECPVGDPEAGAKKQTDMHRFALQNVHFENPFDVTRTPLISFPSFITNIPEYNAVATHQGYVDIEPDKDGYIRRAMLVMAGADGRLYPSLALSMASAIQGLPVHASVDDQNRIHELKFGAQGERIPVSPLGMMEVNFRGGTGTFQYIKAVQIMSESDDILIERNRSIASASKSAILKDAIVLVGLSAVGVFDMRAFPFDSNTPGVEGHANILDNLLSMDMLRHGDGSVGTIWIYFLMIFGALAFAMAVERLESVPALILFSFFLSGGYVLDQRVLFQANANWNTSLLGAEFAAIFFLTFAAKYILEERNKKEIREAFGKYVAPAVVDQVLKDRSKLAVGGEKKELTILFSDIRSFTTFSEKLDAKTLSNFLNDYLGRMTDIVFETGGTLDKYIGDAVMAFWGAPLDQKSHAAQATQAALRMQAELERLRPEYRRKYGIDVRVGIGLNSGSVTVGNMGSDRIFEYTVIGDQVNLASRVEGLTKDYHSEILTTRNTFDLIQATSSEIPPHRVLDCVKVKGKSQAVELIQVLSQPMSEEGLRAFEQGRKYYLDQRWDQAIEHFQAAAELLKTDAGPDQMSLTYIERCKDFKLAPPDPHWDGAWVMKTK